MGLDVRLENNDNSSIYMYIVMYDKQLHQITHKSQ